VYAAGKTGIFYFGNFTGKPLYNLDQVLVVYLAACLSVGQLKYK